MMEHNEVRSSNGDAAKSELKESIKAILERLVDEWIAQGRDPESVYGVRNFMTGKGLELPDAILQAIADKLPREKEAEHDGLCQQFRGKPLCDCGAERAAAYNRAIKDMREVLK